MKKVAALLCILFALVPTCFAEEASDHSYLDGMGVEELMTLRMEIDSRLAQEGLHDSNAIPAGQYVVGTDIKAGTYVLKHMYAPDSSSNGVYVFIYASLEDAKQHGIIIDSWYMEPGEEQLIRLEDGQCFSTNFMTLYLFDFGTEDMKKSWQP